MADGRELLLGPGGLAGFTVHLEAEPNPGTRRLMDWLGVKVEVRPVSDTDIDRVRRPDRMRVRTMGRYDAGYELPAAAAGKPDWIDYRASVGRAERRLEVGELVSRCWSCKTELDVVAPVHSPRCRRNGTDGREALDAMDGLVSQAELLDDQADEEEDVDVELAEQTESEEEVETVSAAARWDRESIVAAIKAWAGEHGAPPGSRDWNSGSGDYPSTASVKRAFGSWADAIAAAGFDRPTRGGAKRSSVGEPKAREASGHSSPAPSSSSTAKSDDAVLGESPSPLVGSEAGSPTDEHGDQADGHHDWLLSLGLNAEMLTDEIARLDELSLLCAQRRDALQRFLNDLAVV